MVDAYGQSLERIQADLKRLTDQIEQARADGQDVTPGWLYQRGRLQELERQVAGELDRFARTVESTVTSQQRGAVESAQDAAQVLATKQEAGVAVNWAKVPTHALEDLVGFASDGSPLRELLEEISVTGAGAARKVLTTGLVMGHGARVTARRLRDELGVGLVRALRISRTETLRAYRESSRRSFEANKDVVQGWIWTASLSGRTCPACLAMHGSVHPVEKRLDGHPNCRCTMVPLTRSTKPLETGERWFERQPADLQDRVLRKGGKKAYDELKLELRDLVSRPSSARWGTMRRTKGLQEAVAESGMPKVELDAKPEPPISGPAPRIAISELRKGIRMLRDAHGDVSSVTIRRLPQTSTSPAWVLTYEPDIIRIPNAIADYEEHVVKYGMMLDLGEKLGHLSAEQVRNLRRAAPSNYAERLGEGLLHEYGHTLTIRKVGNYMAPGFDWAAHLPDEVLNELGPISPLTPREMGEVVAEDARRALQGRDSRISHATWQVDWADLDYAWRRAEAIWKWLKS